MLINGLSCSSMRILIIYLFLCLICNKISAQQSDFIVLKKRNNRTVKTYIPGSFLSARTYTGFLINGKIRKIKNDSIFVEQIEFRQVPTGLGVPRIDTLSYHIAMHYTEIRDFYFSTFANAAGSPRRRGFAQVSLPRLMVLGGSAFMALELVNTAYRKEPLNDQGKLTALAIAGVITGTGLIWQHLQNQSTKPGVKFKVLYVK